MENNIIDQIIGATILICMIYFILWLNKKIFKKSKEFGINNMFLKIFKSYKNGFIIGFVFMLLGILFGFIGNEILVMFFFIGGLILVFATAFFEGKWRKY